MRCIHLGQEGVEAKHQLLVPAEQLLHPQNHSGSVDPAAVHAMMGAHPACPRETRGRECHHSQYANPRGGL